MKRLRFLMIMICLSLFLTVWSLPPGAALGEEIVLNYATFLPKTHPETVSLQKNLIDVINERGKGKVVFKYRGGPETFPSSDIGDALHKGIVDFATAVVTYYQELAPGVAASRLSPFEATEERKNGVYDYIDMMHRKGGLKYMGRSNPCEGGDKYFYTFMNKKPMKPEDWKGLRIGAAGSGRPAVESMGAGVVTVRLSEYYTSMERGLVDGVIAVPLAAWVAWGIHEKTKYVIDHPFFQATGLLIANLKKWNGLPKDVQDLIMGRMLEFEGEAVAYETRKEEEARKAFIKAGSEFYKFSPEMAKWYHDKIYDSSWKDELERHGKVVSDFKALLEKAK
ncbi:MAG: TRAP transporter substrate-binding protein DctP [Desulfobacterales bacterium]|nr:TRAP transporter substrate-binding protein DctP [Desulfobacterales bacterium]